jgi:hypothetical protein
VREHHFNRRYPFVSPAQTSDSKVRTTCNCHPRAIAIRISIGGNHLCSETRSAIPVNFEMTHNPEKSWESEMEESRQKKDDSDGWKEKAVESRRE